MGLRPVNTLYAQPGEARGGTYMLSTWSFEVQVELQLQLCELSQELIIYLRLDCSGRKKKDLLLVIILMPTIYSG